MKTKAKVRAENQRYYQRNKESERARNAAARTRRKAGPDWKSWAMKRLLAEARRRAEQNSFDFTITAGDVTVPDVCPIFRLPLHQAADGRTWSSPSLDRIDNRRGYVPGNVWVISWRANNIKGDATPAELRTVARGVAKRIREQREADRAHMEWPR